MPEQRADDLTFLFTDIEGSTRLLADLGAAYGPVLDRHRALVHHAIEVNGGRVVDRRGDEFFASFIEPAGAVQRPSMRSGRCGRAVAGAPTCSHGCPPWARAHRGRRLRRACGAPRRARLPGARGGEILVSDAVEVDHASVDLGEVQLKGIRSRRDCAAFWRTGSSTSFRPCRVRVPR